MMMLGVVGCSNEAKEQDEKSKEFMKERLIADQFISNEKLQEEYLDQNNEKIEPKKNDVTEEGQPKERKLEKTSKHNQQSNSEGKTTTNEQLKNQGITMVNLLLPEEVSEPREKPVTHIVLHFTSNGVKNPENPYDIEEIYDTFTDYGVSAHYLVGREGQVYELVTEERVAYHAGQGTLQSFPQYKDELNQYSIGIEIMAIGTREEMGLMMPDSIYDSISESDIGYTEAQYQTINHLVDAIITSNPGIKKNREHIVGHDEYAPDRKTDPGSLFDWREIGL